MKIEPWEPKAKVFNDYPVGTVCVKGSIVYRRDDDAWRWRTGDGRWAVNLSCGDFFYTTAPDYICTPTEPAEMPTVWELNREAGWVLIYAGIVYETTGRFDGGIPIMRPHRVGSYIVAQEDITVHIGSTNKPTRILGRITIGGAG